MRYGDGRAAIIAITDVPDVLGAQLSAALVEVEEHLQFARRFYNGAVRDYNDAGQRFPALLVARGFGFAAAEFFQAGSDSRAAPKLDLSP